MTTVERPLWLSGRSTYDVYRRSVTAVDEYYILRTAKKGGVPIKARPKIFRRFFEKIFLGQKFILAL